MRVLTIIFFVSICLTNAQNLVLNPSFEEFENCPKYKGQFHDNVKHWSASNFGSTDYFNYCSESLNIENYVGYQTARTGSSYAGFYTFGPGSYREYIQGELKESLKKDSIYEVSFFISLSDCSSHAIKKISCLFTNEKLDASSKKFIHLKNLDKKKVNYQFISLEKEYFLEENQEWVELKFEYKANGFESYFSIGNFDINKELEKKEIWKTAERIFSYYYIDDVNVTLKSKLKKIETSIVLIENETYTLKSVNFDFDKAILLNSSLDELERLYTFLSKNQLINIEIYGHTDNQGSEDRNNELSLQRANAVSEFLISKGIDANRIKSFGYGSTKPISNNDLEEGRAKNRRVEFKLLKTK